MSWSADRRGRGQGDRGGGGGGDGCPIWVKRQVSILVPLASVSDGEGDRVR